MIERWRTRPVEVEAIVYDGSPDSREEVELWSGMDLTVRLRSKGFEKGDAVIRDRSGCRIVKADRIARDFEYLGLKGDDR